jgi:6-phosphofructokinase
MRIGLLTGGGDCPGLNAAIRAVVRVATASGDEIVGFHRGWRGVVEGDSAMLTTAETKGILQSGGTILRTARYHPDEHEGGTAAVLSTLEQDRIDALIVIGGDGTLASANQLARTGVPIVGIPKTIDNDVSGTRRCIGFDTAVATAAEAIDRVHTTGESHDRLMVVEVMGRTTGWLAVSAGIAAGADAICLPEEITDLDALAKAIHERHNAGSTSSVVVVAEGARFLGAIERPSDSMGALVSAELASRTGYETRLTVLGHVQRGGAPTAADRLLATTFGVAAVDAVHAHSYNSMVCVQNEQTELTSLDTVAQGPRPVPDALLEIARRLTVN